jgi:hypothetical protein
MGYHHNSTHRPRRSASRTGFPSWSTTESSSGAVTLAFNIHKILLVSAHRRHIWYNSRS